MSGSIPQGFRDSNSISEQETSISRISVADLPPPVAIDTILDDDENPSVDQIEAFWDRQEHEHQQPPSQQRDLETGFNQTSPKQPPAQQVHQLFPSLMEPDIPSLKQKETESLPAENKRLSEELQIVEDFA